MLIIPAIDLRSGKCVRLVEGKLDQETIYSDDPVAQAKTWEDLGAKMIHLVDLDGAFTGSPKNLEVVKEILQAVKTPVELGGGIRDLATIKMLLEMGIERVILGTVAINHPELVKEACALYGDRVIVGIDSKNGFVAIEGWEATVEKTTVELALEMKAMGLKRVVFTDIRRDGTMKGPNLESTQELAEKTGLKVVASGGVSSIQDVRNLKALEPFGVDSVIMGKALYTGDVKLEEALAIAEG